MRRVSLSARSPAVALALGITVAASLLLGAGCLLPGGGPVSGDAGLLESPPFSELLDTAFRDELPGRLVIYFLATGQSDATYIRTPGGKVVLIDTGDDPSDVVPFLRDRKKVTKIDVLVLTHPHQDHIGGALGILESFDVGALYDPGFESTSPVYAEVLAKALDLVESGRLAYVTGRAGLTVDLGGGAAARLVHPVDPLDNEANNASVVARVTFGSFSALFAGDVEAEAEMEILDRGEDVSATVLKVAHHGSGGSSTGEFLAAVGMDVAVIEVGPNSFGHPSPAAVARLESAGAEVFSTLDGSVIIVHSDGRDWGLLVGQDG
ncbi:MAG: MBL fold metallo-hydrolase [Bacillota bacterium]|nr:MAG: MBL fold metallo-hydrolase [Bacillota bacterium]